MAIFFTADTHFFHDNILKFDNRPFHDMKKMCEIMKKTWNAKVSKGDIVYILGDYSWKKQPEHTKYLQSLNGRKRLIQGNHDYKNASRAYKDLFESIKPYDEIKVTLNNRDTKKCILSHYPIHFYNGHYYGAIMLYGHVHSTAEYDYTWMFANWLREHNCSVEMYNCFCGFYDYEPVTLDEILEKNKGRIL